MASKRCDNPIASVPHRVLRFGPEDIYKIKSMEDFYLAVGLDLKKEAEEKTITDIQQLWMNAEQCESLRELVYHNLSRDKFWKNLSERYLNNSVSMDWLCYSPFCAPYIPRNELWIFSGEDFRNAVDAHREWRKGEEDV